MIGAPTLACAHRQPIDVDELMRIHDSDPQLAALRVYVDARLLVVYRQPAQPGDFAMTGGVVEERESSTVLRQIIGRRRAGAVIAASEDERTLWISFDPACTQIDCTFTFVADEEGAFVLSAAPLRDDRAAPEVYRRRQRRPAQLVPNLVNPEQGATEVLVRERRRRPPITVGLELKKRSYRHDRSETERARGFSG